MSVRGGRPAHFYYAGIDEAGYGPVIGPLVVARSVFRLATGSPSAGPPSLWTVMRSAVCRRAADSRNRIAVNDSKLLYTPRSGLAQLERGVLTMLRCLDWRPETLDELLRHLAYDGPSVPGPQQWYRQRAGGPPLPVNLDAKLLERSCGRIRRAAEAGGAILQDTSAAVVFEDRYNLLLRQAGSKAACAWAFVAGHLNAIWHRFAERPTLVVVDRQGGRTMYRHLLAELFPGASVTTVEESLPRSLYTVEEGDRRMEVRVQVRAETYHLPVALASMTAKYVRELLMMRLHAFWRRHAPQIRPSFGYFADGYRFVRQIEPLLDGLHIERDQVVRRR
jgi:hypothetical protein